MALNAGAIRTSSRAHGSARVSRALPPAQNAEAVRDSPCIRRVRPDLACAHCVPEPRPAPAESAESAGGGAEAAPDAPGTGEAAAPVPSATEGEAGKEGAAAAGS